MPSGMAGGLGAASAAAGGPSGYKQFGNYVPGGGGGGQSQGPSLMDLWQQMMMNNKAPQAPLTPPSQIPGMSPIPMGSPMPSNPSQAPTSSGNAGYGVDMNEEDPYSY